MTRYDMFCISPKPIQSWRGGVWVDGIGGRGRGYIKENYTQEEVVIIHHLQRNELIIRYLEK